MSTVKVGIDVAAGIMPGQSMPEYFRQWFITSEEWQEASEDETGMAQAKLLADLSGKAQAWSIWLQFQPSRVNWVKTEWIWF